MPSHSVKQDKVINIPNREDLAYAAGFFDGEGHICISFATARKSRGHAYDRYMMSVSMSQNDPAALQWLAAKFGGNARQIKASRSYDKKIYQRWDWSLTCRNAMEFLLLLRPFLKVKGEQADIAIEFQRTMDVRHNPTPPDVVEKRKELYGRIRAVRKPFTSGASIA